MTENNALTENKIQLKSWFLLSFLSLSFPFSLLLSPFPSSICRLRLSSFLPLCCPAVEPSHRGVWWSWRRACWTACRWTRGWGRRCRPCPGAARTALSSWSRRGGWSWSPGPCYAPSCNGVRRSRCSPSGRDATAGQRCATSGEQLGAALHGGFLQEGRRRKKERKTWRLEWHWYGIQRITKSIVCFTVIFLWYQLHFLLSWDNKVRILVMTY